MRSMTARAASTLLVATLVVCWSPGVRAVGAAQKGRGEASEQRGRGNGRGADDKGKANGRAEKREAHDWHDQDFARRVVIGYYDAHGLPPGLAKRRSLPPGLARQVRERGHLPPGLQRHLVPLPPALERDLPPLPPHCVRRFAGSDLLVIDLRLNVILSITGGVLIR